MRLRWGTGAALSALMGAAFFTVAAQIVGLALGPEPPSAGELAPPFQGQTLAGETVSSDDLGQEVVLLDFWATWCPPCVAAMPHLQALHARYESQGLRILGVNQEPGQPARVRRFLKTRGIEFPSLVDESGAIAARYGVHTFPTTYLVGRDGRVITSYRGVPQFGRLEQQIQDALQTDP
ncbi:MAG: TlpA disulfide reductase family protein [Myxococcota bacterium]